MGLRCFVSSMFNILERIVCSRLIHRHGIFALNLLMSKLVVKSANLLHRVFISAIIYEVVIMKKVNLIHLRRYVI